MHGLSPAARLFLHMFLVLPLCTLVLTGDWVLAGVQALGIGVMTVVFVIVEARTTRK